MKKYISSLFLTLCLALGLASCSVETNVEPGGTKVQDMCGYWVVTADACDPDTGDVLYEDPWGIGEFYLITSNTSDDTDDEIMLTSPVFRLDGGGNDVYSDLNFRVNCDLATKTFSCESKPFNADDEAEAVVTNGKITFGTATGVHGGPIDEISFDVSFDDDDYGFLYRVHGVRYEGF